MALHSIHIYGSSSHIRQGQSRRHPCVPNAAVAVCWLIATTLLTGASAFSSGQASDPKINFVQQPPSHAIVSKISPVVLVCEALLDPDVNSCDDDAPNHIIDADHDLQNSNDDDYDRNTPYSALPQDEADHRCRHMLTLTYKWFRNDIELHPRHYNVTENITYLSIPSSNQASGTYRCLANGTELGVGAILSTACRVEQADLSVIRESTLPSTIQATLNNPLLLNCPFRSVPPANVSWYFANKSAIAFDKHDRFILLNNGSFVITSVRTSDYQKFRWIAKNNYSNKPNRSSILLVEGSQSTTPIIATTAKLFPPLQNNTIKIVASQTLRLVCVSYSSQPIRWSFTSRIRPNETVLIHNDSKVIVFANASHAKHSGVYNCSSGGEYQLFNVSVMTPPVFSQMLKKVAHNVAYNLSWNCSATGYPEPTIKFYRNGVPIEYGLLINYKAPSLHVYSLELTDQGIYQCVAENEAGSILSTAVLTVTQSDVIPYPMNLKCFPINHSSLLITFDYLKASLITTYIFTQDPKTFENVILSLPDATIQVKRRLQTFTLYARALQRIGSYTNSPDQPSQDVMAISKLSDGIQCATQGLEISSITAPNGIFVWWHRDALAMSSNPPTHFTIQFHHNDTTNPTVFSDEIVGTTQAMSGFPKWEDIDNMLEKIVVVSREATTRNDLITSVQVPGYVTGMLIPNTNKIVLRVLVPILDTDGRELELDLKHLEWKTIENITRTSGVVDEVESRRITFRLSSTWSNLSCITVCFKNLQIIEQEQCEKFNTKESNYLTVNHLESNSPYIFKLFLCDNPKKTNIVTFEVWTKHDVPGAVRNHKITRQNNGVLVSWSAPMNSNRVFYYQVMWTINNETSTANVTDLFYKIPKTDKADITIRSMGEHDAGIPIFIKYSPSADEIESEKHSDPILGISLGVSLSVLCVIACIWLILYQRRCVKNNQPHRLVNYSTSATGPQPQSITCTTNLHEMQTLIAKPDPIASVVPNGKVKMNGKDAGVNEMVLPTTNHRPISSSTPVMPKRVGNSTAATVVPTDSVYDAIFICANNDEAVKGNGDVLTIIKEDDNSRHSNGHSMTNGFVVGKQSQQHPPLVNAVHIIENSDSVARTASSIPTPLVVKANGNLRITENPQQYLTDPNSNTSFDNNSQQKLLDSTVESSSNSIAANAVELDDTEEDDSRHNSHPSDSYHPNDCSIHSQNALTGPWNYRQPIVGPNG